jgi:hypothetical protein
MGKGKAIAFVFLFGLGRRINDAPDGSPTGNPLARILQKLLEVCAKAALSRTPFLRQPALDFHLTYWLNEMHAFPD